MAVGRPQAPSPCAACGIPGEPRGASSPTAPDCAPGDSPRTKLCIWRQRAARNGPWLSPDAQSVSRCVAGCTVWHAGCRLMHSLACRLSPGRQSGWRGLADSTGGDGWPANSTAGDSKDPFLPPSCRRDVSLACGLSPGRQPGLRAVAVCTVWPRTAVGHAAQPRVSGSRLTSNSRTERSERSERSRGISCAAKGATYDRSADRCYLLRSRSSLSSLTSAL